MISSLTVTLIVRSN